MEGLNIVLSTVLACVAVLALLFTGFNYLLNAKLGPIEKNQARFDSELKEIKTKLDQLLAKS